MSQSSEDSSRVGSEFDLPYEILSVIPEDPYDQLDLARKITSMAIASRVTMLESETGRLRQKLHEKDRVIVELQDKVSQVEQAYEEAELRLKSTREDNMKLLKERDSLALTTKKLSRDLAKFKFELVSREHQFQDYNLCLKNSSRLETFKRQLMQSLNDENSPQAETVDIGTYDHTVSKAYTKNDEDTNGYARCHSYSGSTDTASIADNASKQAGRICSITPYITSGLTPIGTPKVISNSASPGRYSAAGSPKKTSGTTSPRIQYGRGSLSSWYPSSQQSSATNSPPRGLPVPARPPRIDGKEFFRQARSRLSLEQFSAFLANIKELNAQKKSREETLRKAEEIFGMENKDLYLSFQGLLNRNKH